MKDPRQLKTSEFLFDEENNTITQDPSFKEQIANKVVDEIFNAENVDVKTELNDKEILLFSRADFYAQVYNAPLVNDFTRFIKTKKISRKRGSRKEMVDAIKSIDMGGDMGGNDSSLISRLRGF